MFWTTFFILVNGFTVFYKWDVSKFLTSCVYSCVGFSSRANGVSRYQYPDLHRSLPWLQDFLQDQDSKAEGCRPRNQHSFNGGDRTARDPTDNDLGKDRCCGILMGPLVPPYFSIPFLTLGHDMEKGNKIDDVTTQDELYFSSRSFVGWGKPCPTVCLFIAALRCTPPWACLLFVIYTHVGGLSPFNLIPTWNGSCPDEAE